MKSVGREGKIELEDGRKLPGNYRQFDFGYTVTAHRSQGKTVDAVVISADSMKRELFCVAASRGRESETVNVNKTANGVAETIRVAFVAVQGEWTAPVGCHEATRLARFGQGQQKSLGERFMSACGPMGPGEF